MSTAHTGLAQLARLESLGYVTTRLPALRDVDYFADAIAVARHAPATRFAAAVRRIGRVGGDHI